MLAEKQRKDEEQLQKLMKEYPNDWLFHYHELMSKEEKQLNAKKGNAKAGNTFWSNTPGKKATPPPSTELALESLSGSIDIADLKSITFAQY